MTPGPPGKCFKGARMAKARSPPFRHLVVIALVLGGHILLVILLAESRIVQDRTDPGASDPGELLVLVNLPPEPERKPPEAQPLQESGAASSSNARPIRQASAPDPLPEIPASTDPGSAETDLPSGPAIDWELEAKLIAEEMAPDLLREYRIQCEEAARQGRFPAGCKQRSYVSRWEVDPKRVGMEWLIPIVRIGKRCWVTLGYFQCTLGKLPDPDGTLFKNMTDVDLPISSVPELDEALYGPQLVPQPFSGELR